jgi:hypothetical protein
MTGCVTSIVFLGENTDWFGLGEATDCEPIDLSHFVVDLREIHLDPKLAPSWGEFNTGHLVLPTLHYHQWCALSKKALWSHNFQ